VGIRLPLAQHRRRDEVSGGFYRFGTPGAPDIIAVREGRAIFLKEKTATGKLSESQEAFRQGALDASARYQVIGSIGEG
jgi:hypothetical protein